MSLFNVFLNEDEFNFTLRTEHVFSCFIELRSHFPLLADLHSAFPDFLEELQIHAGLEDHRATSPELSGDHQLVLAGLWD